VRYSSGLCGALGDKVWVGTGKDVVFLAVWLVAEWA
jgi:hypothetical protein